MRVPLIIAGSPVAGTSVARQQQLTRAFAWATDISPTILSMAGVGQPGQRYAGRPVQPMTGRDLSPLITGSAERVYGPDDAVGYELTDHGVKCCAQRLPRSLLALDSKAGLPYIWSNDMVVPYHSAGQQHENHLEPRRPGTNQRQGTGRS